MTRNIRTEDEEKNVEKVGTNMDKPGHGWKKLKNLGPRAKSIQARPIQVNKRMAYVDGSAVNIYHV
jgi:hypothetical protein